MLTKITNLFFQFLTKVRSPVIVDRERTLRSWGEIALASSMLFFAAIILGIGLTRQMHDWSEIKPLLKTDLKDWKVLYGETGHCAGAQVESECPASPFNTVLWNSPYTKSDEHHASKVRALRGKDGLWIGTVVHIPSDLPQRQFVIGYLHGEFEVFINGLLVASNVEKPSPTRLVVTLSAERNYIAVHFLKVGDAIFPDIFNRAYGGEGVFSQKNVFAMDSSVALDGLARPAALGLIQALVATLFFFLWLSDRRRQECYYLSVFLFVQVIIQVRLYDAVDLYFPRSTVYSLDLLLRILEATFALTLGLSFARVKKYFIDGVVLITLIAIVALWFNRQLEPIYIMTLSQSVGRVLVTPAYILGACACLFRAVNLSVLNDFKDKVVVIRVRRLVLFAFGLSFSAFVYAFYARYVTSASHLIYWHRFVHLGLALFMSWIIFSEYRETERNSQIAKVKAEIAEQVSHDIRSPLAALLAVVANVESVDSETRNQIKAAAIRIRDIAEDLLAYKPDLLNQAKPLEEEFGNELHLNSRVNEISREVSEPQLITHKLASIVSEKRFQYLESQGVEINFNEASMRLPYFVNVQAVEFARVLSNLIDNAVQAVGSIGKVTIDLKGDDRQVQIIVEDTGVGMSPDVLSKIGARGYSHGKDGSESGSGLGVYHAMETVESWNGNLKYFSELGKGTKAIVTLPRIKAPSWFAEHISVTSSATVIILHDESSMHELWRERFRLAGLSDVQVLGFSTSRALIQWYREALGEVSHPFYLCDYELGDSDHNGLDVIEMLGVASQSILITHRWDEVEIRARCLKLGVKLMPKGAKVLITKSA